MTAASSRLPTAASIEARLLFLDGLRLLVALTGIGFAWATGHGLVAVTAATVGYASVIAACELIRSRDPARLVALTGRVVVADACYLTLLVAFVSPTTNLIVVLVLVLITAIAQLLSYSKALALAGMVTGLLVSGEIIAPALLPVAWHTPTIVVVGAPISIVVFALTVATSSRLAEAGLQAGTGFLEARVALESGLSRRNTPEDLLALLARHICDELGFERVAVLVRERSGWKGARILHGVVEIVTTRHAGGPTVAGVWEDSGAQLVRALDDPLLDVVLPLATNVAVVGLHDDTGPIGVVVAEWGATLDTIPTAAVHALAQATAHAALAIRNCTLVETLREMAGRDPLTGSANRRRFDDAIATAVAAARNRQTPLSLLALDVDAFKGVNDRFGHPVGDQVLRELAFCLGRNTASTDLVARLGGDEFMVLLPDCDAGQARAVAARLSARATASIAAAAVTVSIGAATMGPTAPTTAADLIARADAALYAAKRARTHLRQEAAPGSGPVAAGRSGSAPQADHDPANNAVGPRPADSSASRS